MVHRSQSRSTKEGKPNAKIGRWSEKGLDVQFLNSHPEELQDAALDSQGLRLGKSNLRFCVPAIDQGKGTMSSRHARRPWPERPFAGALQAHVPRCLCSMRVSASFSIEVPQTMPCRICLTLSSSHRSQRSSKQGGQQRMWACIKTTSRGKTRPHASQIMPV